MKKKDYELIGLAFKHYFGMLHDGTLNEEPSVSTFGEVLADHFVEAAYKFDRDKFYQSCGIEADPDHKSQGGYQWVVPQE